MGYYVGLGGLPKERPRKPENRGRNPKYRSLRDKLQQAAVCARSSARTRLMSGGPVFMMSCQPLGRASEAVSCWQEIFRPELQNLFLQAGDSATFLLTDPLAYVLAYHVGEDAMAGRVAARKTPP